MLNRRWGTFWYAATMLEAKNKVMEIIERIGARAFDWGPATNAYIIEGLTGVIIHLNRKYKSKHGSIKITGIRD